MNLLWKINLVTLSLVLLSVTDQCFAKKSRIVGGTIVESHDRVKHQVSQILSILFVEMMIQLLKIIIF